MSITTYQDFVVSADVAERGEDGLARSVDVRVFASPAGESAPLRRELPADLVAVVGRLDRRKLDVAGIIGLGEALADLLLPAPARELLVRSLDRLAPDTGLRLRLRLPLALAGLPWEYLYIQRAEGSRDATGFLALDPRLSITRHEALPVAADVDASPRPRRLLAALASPANEAALDLSKERAVIEAATADVPGLTVEVLPNATAEALLDSLAQNADLFHFAGHGVFEQTGLGLRPGSVTGHGSLVLLDSAGNAAHMAADQLAVNLRGRGVQVVVLGACETGKRDEEQGWSSVAAALMEAGIPAVVAMQFRVWDDAAIAFARALYRGLAAGLPLDQAVSLGRLQVFNLVNPRQDGMWREWGVPVVYLRAAGDLTLSSMPDADARAAAAAELRVVADLRVAEIGPQARYVGVEAGAIEGGSIESYLTATTVSGSATLVDAETITGGDIRAKAEVESLTGGQLTGVRLGRVGGEAPSGPVTAAGPAAPTEPAAPSAPVAPIGATTTGPACSSCGGALTPGAKFCPACGTPVPAGPRFCSQCGSELAAGAKFCAQCGTPTA